MTYSIEDFLQVRTAGGASFSPAGTKVLVHSNLTGTMQLYRVPVGGGDLLRLTDGDEPVSGRYLPASDEILVTRDTGGDERTQIYVMDDDGSRWRPLVHDPAFIHTVAGVSRDGTLLAYATNRRNGADFDIIVRDLTTGHERCVFDRGGYAYGGGFSPDGRFIAVGRATERAGDNQMFVIEIATGDSFEVAPHDDTASVEPPSWMPDGSAFFFSCSVQNDVEYVSRFDMATRTARPVFERGRSVFASVDRTGSHLLLQENIDGYTSCEIFDPVSLEHRVDVPLPRRGIASVQFSPDGRYLAYAFASPVDAGDVWIYDIAGATTRRLTTSPGAIPPETFVEPSVARISSFDGEQIAAFVFRPQHGRGVAPVVLNIHGGPESQYAPMFSPVTQFLVSRGFAVIAPNVRGSNGYGKRFLALDDRRKRLDSVRDLEAIHAWIDEQPDLDASRAALMGGSYGGYMVLAGLAFQPDLWAAGVDIVGISSLVTFLQNTSPYRRRVREREYGFLDEDMDFLIEASPITHVDRMRAPLMIIHGANDPRVPLGEAEQIHEVLRAKNVPCELLVYHDEGHGLAKLSNRMDAYPKVAAFLEAVLA